ncbi:MAG: hypothetical protein JWR38_4656 [Mucilaginibacter sp.]|nr:hypothetical protein [Mucilaginibacter sp.]
MTLLTGAISERIKKAAIPLQYDSFLYGYSTRFSWIIKRWIVFRIE